MRNTRLPMMMALQRTFAVVLALWLCMPIQARAEDSDEGRYRVPMADPATLARAGARVDGLGPGFVDIRASAATVARLRARGLKVERLAQPQIAVDPAYHTYEEMKAEVGAVAAAHPTIVSRFSIGKSYEGRELIAAKVSDNVSLDEHQPEVLFIGHYHAREHLTVEMMLYILHMLVDGYGTSEHAAIDRLVNTREIWLVFDANPDGGEYDLSGGNYHYWRKNRQPSGCAVLDQGEGFGSGIDMNRNHGYKWGYDSEGSSGDTCDATYRGSAPTSTPEVAAIEQFVNSRVVDGVQQITAAISFHTYGKLVLWPYGYTNNRVPADMNPDDIDALEGLGKLMAGSNGYTPQQASELYLTNGDFTDWAYGTHRIFAYTFEMSGEFNRQFYDFYPPGAAIPTETARNRAAVLSLLAYAGCPYAFGGAAARYCTGGRYEAWHTLLLPIAANGATN